MYSKGLHCLLLLLLPALIDARLVPTQLIDGISTDNILHIPIVVPANQASKRQTPPTTTPPRANTTVCYPVVGCFNNVDPFNNAALEVPQNPAFINTHFLLFTQESPNEPEFLLYDGTDDSLIQSSINPSRWLRIIVHGFTNTRDSVWIKPMKDALLKLGEVRRASNPFPTLSTRDPLGSDLGCARH